MRKSALATTLLEDTNSYPVLTLFSGLSDIPPSNTNTDRRGREKVSAKKMLLGAIAVMALLVGAGVAYANSTQDATAGDQEGDGSYKGSIAVPDQSGPSLQELAKIDQSTAEQAALEAVPGTVKQTDLENENGYVVYDVEVAGNDGKTHDVKVDAGNGDILHQQVDGPDGPGDTEDADGSGDTEDANGQGDVDEPGDSDGPGDTEDAN
jgi:uncharacterized membrane protein YkoI